MPTSARLFFHDLRVSMAFTLIPQFCTSAYLCLCQVPLSSCKHAISL
jgi:hypothetical protein